MSFTIATTIEQALELMAAGARPVAGGTDLVVGARHGKAPLPTDVVAIDRLKPLRHVGPTEDGLLIGSLVSHHEIEHHHVLRSTVPALPDASALVGSPATRHVGTIGGNVMNASPAMDTGSPLVVLGAEAELWSTRGKRRVSMAELWNGPGRTSASTDELCVAVHVPSPGPNSSSAYIRLEYRRAMEIAVVGAAAAVTVAGDGTVTAVRVALTAVAPTILEVTGLDSLVGGSVDDVATAVAAAASEQARPISDVRASDRYRRHAVGVMAGRAVRAAALRATGTSLPTPLNRSLGIGATS